MSTAPSFNRDYCDELLIQQAVYGLDPAEAAAMDDLIREFDVSEEHRFESVIGALDAGFTAAATLPADLKKMVEQQAVSWMEYPRETTVFQDTSEIAMTTSRSTIDWTSREKFFGFLTAASLLLALASLAGWLDRPDDAPTAGKIDSSPVTSITELSPESRLQRLIDAPDTDRFMWSNPTNDRASANAGGEVVWNEAQQMGFMVLEGLQVNDPAEKQYQLWIFDTNRSDDFPVDGGVFDVTETGRLIVPIDAKLSITHAKAFAVTIEQPGGAVVSERERLPLLAGKL